MTPREELLPCPFCGNEAALGTIRYSSAMIREQNWGQDTFHKVNCVQCGANNLGLVGYRTPELAAEAWNRRYLATRDAQGEGAVLSEERAKFQRETRRTSALTQLLWRWMERQEALGCSSDPWPKGCASCDLMRDTKALLYSPINVDPPPSDASRGECNCPVYDGHSLDHWPSCASREEEKAICDVILAAAAPGTEIVVTRAPSPESAGEQDQRAVPATQGSRESGTRTPGSPTFTPPAPDGDADYSPQALAQWLYRKYERHGEIEDKLAADLLSRPQPQSEAVAWATPSLLATMSAVEKNHLTSPERRARGAEFAIAARDADRYSVPLYATPPSQAQVETELAFAKKVIAWANNSLYGSHGYFLSDRGDRPSNEHHLDSAIEEIKAYSRKEYVRAEQAESALAAEKRKVEAAMRMLEEIAYGGYAGASFIARTFLAQRKETT